MSCKQSVGASRSLLFVNALLVTSALSMPAFAQIEEVVVTAQKRSEDIQTVPISITAYSAQDLAAHQIEQVKDLQFSTPSVTYTKGKPFGFTANACYYVVGMKNGQTTAPAELTPPGPSKQ